MKKTLAFLLVVMCTLLIAGELTARFVLGLGDPPLSITDPTIEYMFKPNQDCRRFGNRIFINEWGMRSMPITKDKQDKTEIRILWFGDSVINGGNQTDHDSLATTMLEKALKGEWNRPVRVMNVSAGSWGPSNMLAYLKKYGDFDADLVIVSLSSHDAQDFPTFAPLNKNTHPTKKPFNALYEVITRYLPRYLPNQTAATNQETYTIDPAKEQSVLNDFYELLAELKKRDKGIMVFHHWELLELKSGVKPGRDALKAIADSLQIPWSSDSVELSMALAHGNDPYRDNIHLNTLGQTIVMEKVNIVGLF